MNLEKLDRIIVTESDYTMLHAWVKQKGYKFQNTKSALNEGLIEYKLNIGDSILTHFKTVSGGIVHMMEIMGHRSKEYTGRRIHFTSYMKKQNKKEVRIADFSMDLMTEEVQWGLVNPKIKPTEKENLPKYTASIYSALMLYMVHNVQYVQGRTIRSASGKKNRKGKVKRGAVSMTRKVYTVQAPPPEEDREKRDYTWHVDKFIRRGHEKTLRNGKKIWIPPKEINVGEGKKREPKTYKI